MGGRKGGGRAGGREGGRAGGREGGRLGRQKTLFCNIDVSVRLCVCRPLQSESSLFSL